MLVVIAVVISAFVEAVAWEVATNITKNLDGAIPAVRAQTQFNALSRSSMRMNRSKHSAMEMLNSAFLALIDSVMAFM